MGRGGEEVVYWVADRPGRYVLSIGHAPGSVRPGRYELRLEEPRPATERDRTDCEAQNLYIRAKHLSRNRDMESRREVIALYLRALPLFRELGDRPSEASTLNNIGATFDRLREFDKAIEHYQMALPIWTELSHPRGKADTLRNIGLSYKKMGDGPQALKHLQEALEQYREVGARKKVASTLNDIGLVFGRKGELQEALESYRSALEIFLDLNDERGQAAARNNLGTVHVFLGELDQALQYFQETLHLNRKLGDRNDEATALNNVGYLKERMDDLQGALVHYDEALSILEKSEDDRTRAYTLENVARIHSGLGRHAKALALLDQALKIRHERKDRRGEAYALDGFGTAHQEKGDTATAIAFFERALECARATGDFRIESSALQQLARAERETGRLADAHRHIEQALGIVESVRANVSSQELRYAFFASKRSQYEFYVDLLLELHEKNPASGYDALALQASESARARSLLELLTEANVDVRQGIDEEHKARERDITARLSHLQTRLIEVRSQDVPDEKEIAFIEESLEQAERDRRQLTEEIRREHPRYASLQYPQPLGLTEIMALIDSETALLEYTLGEETSTLFVVTREGLTTYSLSSSAEEIAARVDEMREILKRHQRRDRIPFDKAAHRLYTLLIAPAEPVIADKTRLLIAPDAALYSLSFEALLPHPFSANRFQGMDYLLRRWSVTYVPSASVLASLEESRRRAAASEYALAFLGFGDPDYRLGAGSEAPATWPADRSGEEEVRSFVTDAERWDLRRLKASQYELSEIGRLFDPENRKILLRGEATEENAKSEAYLPHARLIHFATHGVISEQQPQYSGLVLTLDKDPAEDGLFQVYEIFNLKTDADLVVLSTCETGLGKQVRGEGLIGLSRAFLYAGTPSVVVSLWQVADRSTAELMVRFYGHLAQGTDKAEALRQAKLELLEGRFAHSYYWAPFILIGKHQP